MKTMYWCIYAIFYLLASVVNLSSAQNRPRYNVYSLPPFEIKLDLDLWTTVLNGSYLNVRRLDATGTYFRDDYAIDASSNQHDPASALTKLKTALAQATSHKNDATSARLPSYLLALLTEYTNSYLTTFLYSAFDTNSRSEKGWSLVHAVDLRGEWVDVTFRNSQVHYLEGEKDANTEEEAFASLTIAFSGTAAVLQGRNVDSTSDAAVDQNDLLRTSPRISRSLLRLGMNTAFSPPDGPYQFLSHVITSSMEDRLYSVDDINMETPQVMEHDAALILSGGRDVETRMDLDLYPTADFVRHDSIYVAAGTNEQAEKRESIAVFFQGCYMVLFIGGFYIYASYRYRRNYLKWELERYGNKDAILFTHKYKRQRGQKIVNFISGKQWNNRAKHNSSPVTVEIDGVDGFFERELSGVDSSDDDLEVNLERQSFQYCEEPQDLEKGLRESYNESTRNKKGLDMNPIDEQSIGSGNRGTMKAVDDDMPQSPTESASQSPHVDWDEVLENVVPIPASDAVGKLDDRNPTYHIANQDGTGILVQRRYVQPASPFDVLYGAAFLHGEADRVEAQRRLDRPKKKKIRASPSYHMRKKKKKTLTMKLVTDAMNGQKSKDAIRPMMTISEDNGIHEVFNEEEEDVSDLEEENSDTVKDLSQFSPGELRHNASPMSFYSPKNFLRNLSEKYNLGSFDQSAPNASAIKQEGQMIDEKKDSVMQGDYPVEQGVVFCDFPRQDGTPCIIYNRDESGREQSVDDQSDSIDQESDGVESVKDEPNITVDLESDDEEQPDQFAAKMNLLLESKCEQIKERNAMELEMQARRQEREEQKRIAAEAVQQAAGLLFRRPPTMPSTRDSSRKRDESNENNVDIEVLRKEYRNMQANRNAFAHESDLVLRRQQATLDKLRAENETLKADVSRLQTRSMTRPINSFEQSQLDRLYQELDRYTVLVETEKTKATTMEKEMSELRDEIWKKRKQMGGVNAAATNQRNIQKQVNLLESRLDQALVKFNKTVSRNKRLREEIDGLRGERVTFEKVYKKIEKELREKKKQMAIVIEQSNQAYEQRDKAQLEIAAIEQADRKDEDAHHQQMNELSDELEDINQQLLNSSKRNQQPVLVDPAEEERKIAERREAARANEIARAEEEYAQQRKERMQNFEEAFRKISGATGISDVDELVRVFIENEEQNFSLFRYMNEQTAEIERLEDEINALQEEGERCRAKQGDNANDKEEIMEIERQIKATEEQTAIYSLKCEESQKLLDEAKDEIKLLLIRLDCQPSGEGGELSITTDNVLHYLGLVEERAIDIVSNYNRLQTLSDGAHKNREQTNGRAGSRRCSINPPRLLDSDSDNSEDDSSLPRPVHRQDLASRASMLASRASMARQKRKTTFSGRRNSLAFLNGSSRQSIAFSPN